MTKRNQCSMHHCMSIMTWDWQKANVPKALINFLKPSVLLTDIRHAKITCMPWRSFQLFAPKHALYPMLHSFDINSINQGYLPLSKSLDVVAFCSNLLHCPTKKTLLNRLFMWILPSCLLMRSLLKLTISEQKIFVENSSHQMQTS